ncbi:protein kinase [Methanocella sp. CWC-04]|uniref:Protein kinase n=1 Tax=Methanooceanicella nereidis TaxID=2052831 RepID=A0AAP2RBT6_9EURY|nr:phosphotransferase [Methanocella sp. CWC-04]MCD1294036.1 protein kinase [Methanocella sp. CWC-04]
MLEVPPPHPFERLRFIKKFPSKKNSVYLVERAGKQYVLKLYATDRWQNEFRVLSAAYDLGIAVPAPIEARDNAVLMEYIDGKTVNDHLNEKFDQDLVLSVASWLARFHLAFYSEDSVLLKSDAIFKNFILSERIIYGIDFELSRPGRPEEDVGEAISFLLDTEPMFTDEKYRLACKFIKRYENDSGIVLHDIEDSIAKSLIEAASFRPAHSSLLLKKAKDIITLKPFTRY